MNGQNERASIRRMIALGGRNPSWRVAGRMRRSKCDLTMSEEKFCRSEFISSQPLAHRRAVSCFLHANASETTTSHRNDNLGAMMKFLMMILMMVLLSGCGVQQDLSELKVKVMVLEIENKSLKGQIDALNADIAMLKIPSAYDGVAYLSSGSSGYQILKTEIGNITVGLENIEPYANGSKVLLKFGNPTAAEIYQLSATIEWGAVDKDGYPDNENMKRKDVEFVESFRSGAWNSAEVILEGVPPSDLGFVRVKDLKHKQIGLRKLD
jgi:Protein of unknown function (DUF3251)